MRNITTETQPIKDTIDFVIGPLVILGMAYPQAIQPLFSLFKAFETCSEGLSNSYNAIEEMNEDGIKFVLF